MGPINNNLASLSSSKIQSQPDYIYSVQSALHSSERVYMQLTERLYTADKGFTKLRGRVHGEGGGVIHLKKIQSPEVRNSVLLMVQQ